MIFGLAITVTGYAQYAEPAWIRSGVGSAVADLAYSSDNRYLASIAMDGGMKIWDLQSNRLYRYVYNAVATCAVFFQDNQRIATGSTDGTVRIWNIHTGDLVASIQAHNGRVGGVDLSPNGQLVASAGSDGEVKIWNASSWGAVKTIVGHTGAVNTVDFSPDNSSLVTASDDRTVRTWSVATGAQQRIWNDTALHLSKAAVYSPDGQFVAATAGQCFYTSTGCGVVILNASSGTVVKQYTQLRLDATDVMYSPGGVYIATSDDYGTVYTYRPDSLSQQPVIRLRHRAGQQSANFLGSNVVAFNADGSVLASAGDDRVIRYWRASDNTTGIIVDSSSVMSSTDINANRIASGRGDGVIAIRDAGSGDVQRLLVKIDSSRSDLDSRWYYHAGRPVNAVAWRPDGTRLAGGQDDDTIRIWDPSSGNLVRSIDAGSGTTSLAWTKSGDQLLSGHGAPVNGIKVWNASSWSNATTLDAGGAKVTAIDVQGDYVLAGCDNGMARIWNATNWSEVRAVQAHVGAVVDVAVSADGKYMATATSDSIRITTLAEGAEVSGGVASNGKISAIAFSSDNNYLIATTTTAAIVVYRALSGYMSYVNPEFKGDGVSMDVAGGDVYVGTSDGSVIKWPFKPGDFSGELPSPNLISPSLGATGVSSPVLLLWGSVPGATGYDVQASTESSFTTGVIVNQANLIDSARVVANVTEGTTYYWRVRARAATGQSAWSAVWSFTTSGGATILPPSLTDPPDKSADLPLTVTLKWNRGIGAEWYRLQLADNDGFSLPLIDEMQVLDSAYTVTGLVVAQTYYWHVRSRRNGSPSTSPWSPTRSFTTTTVTSVDRPNSPDKVFIALSPNPVADQGIVSLVVPGAGDIRVSLLDNVGRSALSLLDEYVSGPQQRVITFDASMLPSGTYFVRVVWRGASLARPMVVAH